MLACYYLLALWILARSPAKTLRLSMFEQRLNAAFHFSMIAHNFLITDHTLSTDLLRRLLCISWECGLDERSLGLWRVL